MVIVFSCTDYHWIIFMDVISQLVYSLERVQASGIRFLSGSNYCDYLDHLGTSFASSAAVIQPGPWASLTSWVPGFHPWGPQALNMMSGFSATACLFQRTCRNYQQRASLGSLGTGRCFRLRREANLQVTGLMEILSISFPDYSLGSSCKPLV